MNKEQRKRLAKIDLEPFYLINYQYTKEKSIYEFEVSGATANLYTVTFNPSTNSLSKMIKCNCGDACGVGKVHRVKCKHACFIWVRILELPDEYLSFNLFSQGELEYIKNYTDSIDSKLENINPCFRNLDQKKQYTNHLLNLNSDFIPSISTHQTSTLQTSDHHQSTQDTCPICVMSLKKKKVVSCPDCKNLIHYDCIQTWLAFGKTTCIYCRSTSWEDFQLQVSQPSQKNPNPKYGSTKYANLGKYTDYNSLGSESSSE